MFTESVTQKQSVFAKELSTKEVEKNGVQCILRPKFF